MAGEALKKLCNIAICAINAVFCRIWKLHYGIIAQNCLLVYSVLSACIKHKNSPPVAGWSDWAAPRKVQWTFWGVSAAREWTIVNIELPYADALRCFNIKAPHQMTGSFCIIVFVQRLIPNAATAGSLNLTRTGDGGISNTHLRCRNDVVVVHANNLQFCINICFHLINQF